MKKLFMVVLTLAMVASFLPKAEAGESATLGLQVTFAVAPEPIKIWSEPEGPFTVKDGQELRFVVKAEHKYTRGICITAENLPMGATFGAGEANLVLKNPSLVTSFLTFVWRPKFDQIQEEPYRIVFVATNTEGVRTELMVEITVTHSEPLKIWLEPYFQRPLESEFRLNEGGVSVFKVIAEDVDTRMVNINAEELPAGATLGPKELIQAGVIYTRFESILVWQPKLGQAQEEPYRIIFVATNSEGEKVELPVEITVLPARPFRIWVEPEGLQKQIKEGELLRFTVKAEKGASNVVLELKSSDAFGARVLDRDVFPMEDKFLVDRGVKCYFSDDECIVEWTPLSGETRREPYKMIFEATTSEEEMLELTIEITVLPAQPIISIELNEASWVLTDVKLGELRRNYLDGGLPMHAIVNTGNIPLMVDIGYVVSILDTPIHPGLEQGLDTFITKVGETVLPPNERLNLDHPIGPGMQEVLPLTYGAPTALSANIPGMSTAYEIRAYQELPLELQINE